MRFKDIPNEIKCVWCGSSARQSTASAGSFEFYACFTCSKCYKITSRSYPRLKHGDYPATFKCPQCRMLASALEANDEGRVVYEHATSTKVHRFELEGNDAGWGTYQGRAEVVRVYDTIYDCAAMPG